jgi:hypothetical protein
MPCLRTVLGLHGGGLQWQVDMNGRGGFSNVSDAVNSLLTGAAHSGALTVPYSHGENGYQADLAAFVQTNVSTAHGGGRGTGVRRALRLVNASTGAVVVEGTLARDRSVTGVYVPPPTRATATPAVLPPPAAPVAAASGGQLAAPPLPAPLAVLAAAVARPHAWEVRDGGRWIRLSDTNASALDAAVRSGEATAAYRAAPHGYSVEIATLTQTNVTTRVRRELHVVSPDGREVYVDRASLRR